jgi:glutamate decarboxylase
MRGWLVPAYTFPENLQDVAVIRIVVRNGFSNDLADLLLDDIRKQSEALAANPNPNVPLVPGKTRESFRH